MANDKDRLQRHLGMLPDAPLPDALWPRIALARKRQLARRRAVLGAGAAALLAWFVLPGRLPDPHGLQGVEPAAAVASADALPARAPIASDPDARVRIIDRELQSAYRRGSGEAEIAQLWQARAALLRERAPGTRVRPVRI